MKKMISIALVLAAMLPNLASAKASKKQVSGQLNLNTATVEQLDQLPSMSAKKAQLIVDYRKDKPFKSVDELDNVKGFSPKGIEKIRAHISVDGQNTLVVEGGKSKKAKKSASSAKSAQSKKG